jgi:hypothetical protein
MRMGTTAISYAGPVTVGDSGAPIQVRGLHAFTTNMAIGPEFSALARLFKGRIWLDYLYMDSDMSPETARRIADECALVLQQSVTEAGPGATAASPQSRTFAPSHH